MLGTALDTVDMYSCEHTFFGNMCFQSKNFSQCTRNLQQVQHFWINYQACLDDIMYLEHYDSLVPTNDFHAMHTFQVCYSAAAFDIHLPS